MSMKVYRWQRHPTTIYSTSRQDEKTLFCPLQGLRRTTRKKLCAFGYPQVSKPRETCFDFARLAKSKTVEKSKPDFASPNGLLLIPIGGCRLSLVFPICTGLVTSYVQFWPFPVLTYFDPRLGLKIGLHTVTFFNGWATRAWTISIRGTCRGNAKDG